jgi:hypothetical protein
MAKSSRARLMDLTLVWILVAVLAVIVLIGLGTRR